MIGEKSQLSIKEEVKMKETRVTLKKKVLGIFMCLALAIVALPMGKVEAEDATPIPVYGDDQTTTSPSIDTSQKGKITIHKYTEGSETGSVGTGSANDITPAGSAPLAGAKFKIYTVNGFDVTNYYSANPDPATLPVATTYYTKGTDGSITIKTDLVTMHGDESAATGADGTVTFTNLPLGLYLVEESQTPDGVTAPSDPFLVCIPMTITTTDDDGNTVNKWLYDVEVFPKNKTTAGITLEKVDWSDNTALAGVKFVLQKKADSGVWQDIPEVDDSNTQTSEKTELITGATGQISIDGLEAGEYRFVETEVGVSSTDGSYTPNSSGYIMDGATTYAFTANPDGTCTYNGTTGQTVLITVKNDKPTIEKKVEQVTSSDYKDKADYSVGDEIDYQIKIKVPNNIEDLKTFELKDEPINIKYKDNSMSIVNDGGSTDLNAAEAGTYTLTSSGNGFKIEFDTEKLATYKGEYLVLSYTATLETAPADMTIGNVNKATLTYSDNILPDSTQLGSDPNHPNTDLEESEEEINDDATVYSFAIKVTKVGADTGTALKGVKFKMYKQVADTTTGVLDENDYKAAGLAAPDTGKAWIAVDAEKTTDKDGIITWTGLANGDYYLVETATVDGYNLLNGPEKVTINVTYDDGLKDTTTVTKAITIKNSKGFTLPTTGGTGSFLFTLIGCTIMIAGFVIFRKTKAKQADAA